MIFSAPELSDFPASPNPGDVVFNTTEDAGYIWAPGAPGVISGGWLFITNGAMLRSSERITDTLTTAAYAGRDYQTFLDEITANIKAVFGPTYNDFTSSAAGQMIIRFLSAALDTLSFNLDQRSVETYMFLAQLASSVAQAARSLGYKPGVGVAATLTLDQVTLPAGPYSFDVPIPAGFQFNGPNGLIFEMTSQVTIPAGQTSVANVSVFQGDTINESFVSDGTANQRYYIRKIPVSQFIGEDTVAITVNGAVWTEYDFLPFSSVNAFEVSYDSSPPYIRFGDGVLGNVPPAGSDVAITYVSTQGIAGNSVPSGTVTAPASSLTVNFTNIPILAIQTQSSSGGNNPEDPRSVQANAPLVFSTGKRAVSQADWDALLNVYSDPVNGSVAIGRAEIIRTIKNELTIQALLLAINAAADPSGSLSTLLSINNEIRSLCASILVPTSDQTAQVSDIESAQLAAESAITLLLENTANAKAAIAAVSSAAGQVPYQQIIGLTDGTTHSFGITLSRVPIVPGTVSVFLSPLSVVGGGTTGDVTTTPGSVIASASTFFANNVGNMIQIGAEYRVITQYVSPTVVKYSGPAIYSTTSLALTVYGPGVIGFDDGAGNITGAGISSGSISYSTGSVSVHFSPTPGGVPLYGQPIVVAFRYQNTYLQSLCSDATTDIVDAETDAATVTAQLGDMTAPLAQIGTDIISINGIGTNISAQTAASDTAVAEAETVTQAVETATANLATYLGQVISGPCKANIVQCKVLAFDANQDYVAPTQALLNSVGSYFEGIKIITCTVSPVSGFYDVVAVNMMVKLQIATGYLYANVQPIVAAAISALLKKRKYGINLLASDPYGITVPVGGVGGIVGVQSAIIKITGSTFPDPANTNVPPSPTSDGDMVISGGQVIVEGTVTYSQITYPATGS